MNYLLNNGLCCTKLVHSHLLFGQLLCGLKSSIMCCVPLLWLRGRNSSCNSSRLINFQCEWTITLHYFLDRNSRRFNLVLRTWADLSIQVKKASMRYKHQGSRYIPRTDYRQNYLTQLLTALWETTCFVRPFPMYSKMNWRIRSHCNQLIKFQINWSALKWLFKRHGNLLVSAMSEITMRGGGVFERTWNLKSKILSTSSPF